MTSGPSAESLADVLAEQSPRYAGLTTNEVERARRDVLDRLGAGDLPPAAVPFVLEELETGRTPATVAAAGRALRHAAVVPDGAPELLVAAMARLGGRDEVIGAGSGPSDGRPVVTAVGDLAATLTVLGPRAASALPALRALLATDGSRFSVAVRDELTRAVGALAVPVTAEGCCCHGDDAATGAEPTEPVSRPGGVAPPDVVLEDQDGRRRTVAEAFAGRPTALAFFYTRCMNPEKCSLTVSRLARLATRFDAAGVDANVAAISYDPGFDRPGRLRAYGTDRGMTFSPRCSLLRTVGPFEPLRDAFDLGVGFGPVTVNRHRLDLVVLDASLRVATTFERRLWSEDAVFDAVVAAQDPSAAPEIAI